MAATMEEAVMGVVSGSRLFMNHPGDSSLTQLYAGPARCETHLAPIIVYRDAFTVDFSSKVIPGISSAGISTSALYGQPFLEIELPATASTLHHGPGTDGWGFHLIKSIDVTVGNSLIQNTVFSGNDLFQMACAAYKDDEVGRMNMIKRAGIAVGAVGGAYKNLKAFIPLVFLNFTGRKSNLFPQDGSVLPSQVSINVTFNNINYAVARLDNSTAVNGNLSDEPFPGSVILETCRLTFDTTTLQSSAFGVKNAMLLNPSLVLGNTMKYRAESYPLSLTGASRTRPTAAPIPVSVNLISAPAGMLAGIFLSIVNTAGPDVSVYGNSNFNGSAWGQEFSWMFHSVTLTFGGQKLVNWDSLEKIRNRCNYDYENTGECWIYNRGSIAASTAGLDDPIAANLREAKVCFQNLFIPLGYDPKSQLSGNLIENNPNYGSSQLQLDFTFSYPHTIESVNPSVLDAPLGNNIRERESWLDLGANGNTLQLRVLYLIPALLETQSGNTDIQF